MRIAQAGSGATFAIRGQLGGMEPQTYCQRRHCQILSKAGCTWIGDGLVYSPSFS